MQLICLHAEPLSADEPNNFIEVKESYGNLGPIVDMTVVDLERQGQGQLVTCSGAEKEGSLRIIRNGIGINELTSGELPGIKGLWNLRYQSPDDVSPSQNAVSDLEGTGLQDNVIVMAFVGHTKTLLFAGEEPEERELAGFSHEEQTIWAGNRGPKRILQVTPTGVRLIGQSHPSPLSVCLCRFCMAESQEGS